MQIICAFLYINDLHLAGYQANPVPDAIKTEARLKDEFFNMLLYVLGIGIIKVSFGITLLRIMVVRSQVIVVKILIVLIILMTIAIIMVTVLACSPINYFWMRASDPFAIALFLGDPDPAASGLVARGFCTDRRTYGTPAMYSQVGMTIGTDIAIGLVMPYLMLRKLKMRTDAKVTAFVLLALGAIPSIASIVRMFYVYTFTSQNALNEANPLFIWSNIENTWCIAGTALSTLKPLANKLGLFSDNMTVYTPQKNGATKFWSPRSILQRRGQSPRNDTVTEGTSATVWGSDMADALDNASKTQICRNSDVEKSAEEHRSWQSSLNSSTTLSGSTSDFTIPEKENV